jgi:hypothetical protein
MMMSPEPGSLEADGFQNGLTMSLELKIDSHKTTIEAGDIKGLTINQNSFGFDVLIRFWVISKKSTDQDALVSHFTKDSPIDASLSLKRKFERPGSSTDPWILKGLVYSRELFEQVYPAVNREPVLQREYILRFADPAQVLWRDHHPVDLYVDKSLKDIISAQTNDHVKMSTTWTVATTKHPIHCLALGLEFGKASFYDFIHWFADTRHGFIYFDSEKMKYELGKAKKDVGRAQELDPSDLKDTEIFFPEVSRVTKTIHNSFAPKTSSTPVKNSASITGVREDIVLTSPAASVATTRKKYEGTRETSKEHTLKLDWGRLPTSNIQPGCLLKPASNAWSSNRMSTDKVYRVFQINFQAESKNQGATENVGEESNIYKIRLTTELEPKDSKTQRTAHYHRPRWPLHLEAKIDSTSGGKKDLTYQPLSKSEDAVDTYNLEVGLFKKVKLRAPYRPQTLSNHYYVPLYKDQRVIVELSFQHAEIVRILDWRKGAKLPTDSQSNHLLLGKPDEGHTSMLYGHVDNKAQFTIVRDDEGDKQIIELKDGVIVFETS